MKQPTKPGRKQIVRLFEEIYATQVEEPTENQVATMIAQCADGLLSDEEASRLYPQLWQYFRHYPEAKSEYNLVMQLARLESENQLPTVNNLHPRPARAQSPLWERVTQAIESLFPGFTHPMPLPAARHLNVDVQNTARISLGDSRWNVEFHLHSNSEPQNTYELICTFEPDESKSLTDYELTPVWLMAQAPGGMLQEQALNALGDVTFAAIPLGSYTLLVQLDGADYAIKDIHLQS